LAPGGAKLEICKKEKLYLQWIEDWALFDPT
jgi:hypothetical protein